MAKAWYVEMECDRCHCPLGWYIDTGPHGSWICSDCYEEEEDEE